uniref:sodium-independent sulfate anion transporter-like n=1 Tax=Styela clava TaxID=7725 RepID=UPI00193A8DF5|nr:sodium-independent sulfate anion transporter-like [Styela clava]
MTNINVSDPFINNSESQPFLPPKIEEPEKSKKTIFGQEVEFECTTSKCLDITKSYFPILSWLPKYKLNWLQCDIIAGLTVGLTVIPQGLAYAQIAGLPVQYGLYSAFMGGFVYCIFGTSKDITLGPTAIMSLLVHTYGDGDPVQAVLLTFLAGVVQFAMGILRLGFIMRFISTPVISGFTSAAAITIALGQFKHIFGVKTTSSSFVPQLIEMLKALGDTNVWDVVMGLSCIACLVLLRYIKDWIEPDSPDDTICQKISKKFVWVISTARNAVVVISAAFVAYAIHSQDITSCKVEDCVTLTGKIDEGLPDFKPPEFNEVNGNTTVTTKELVSRIGDGMFVIPLMGLLESIAIGKAFARKNNYILETNQEMIAIGASNILSSFVSSYCVTGSFSRTAINAQSNVKTPAGGIFTGALVILSLAVLTPSFYYIPKAALAAVIISAVIYMVDYATVVTLWKVKKIDLLPLIATFLVCFWQIPYGILAGVAVSLLIMLYPNAFPGIPYKTITNRDSGTNVIVTPEAGLHYPAAEYVTDKIRHLIFKKISDQDISTITIDASNLSHLDYTAIQSFIELAEEFNKHDIKMTFINLSTDMMDSLQKADPTSIIIFDSDIDDSSS